MAGDVRAKDDNPRPRKRRRQNESSHRTSQAKLRKEVYPVERRPLIQIRDIQRLLHRPLKANVREEKERALTGLKHQLELGTKANQDLKMAKRYQMKATRRLRQAQKAYEDDQSTENKELVDRYSLDLYYTTHFPLTEKYIALYPKSTIESPEVLDKRDRIRNLLRDQMLHGKKKISGSNNIKLGKRSISQTLAASDAIQDQDLELQDENIGSESEAGIDTEEDEFLDMGQKKH